MSKKKNYQCLMIETRDRRKFFTHQKNYPQLIEFSRTFDCEISVVKVKEAEVLNLVQLAPAICTGTSVKKPDFEIIEVKHSEDKRTRPKILSTAKKIKNYIKELLLQGEVVRLATVSNKFKEDDLTSACFCNHMRSLRKELSAEGIEIERIGHGKYQIKAS